MNVKFIGQGLEKTGDQIGHIISETLKSGKYNNFYAFVAFVSEGGVDRIREGLTTFMSLPSNFTQFFVGVDNKATSKEALEALIDIGVPTSIYYTPTNSVIYHPKIYYFKGENSFRLITGSSNLTVTGLFQNVETSLVVDSDYEQGKDLFQSLENFFNKFFKKTDPNLKDLDISLLKELETLKIVPTENSMSYNGEISNTSNKETDEKDSSADETETNRMFESLKGHFPKREIPGAPPRFTKKIRTSSSTNQEGTDGKEETTKETSPNTQQPEPISPPSKTVFDPAAGSGHFALLDTAATAEKIWFMSGKLTGGSRNILDLSHKGRNGGTGGVHLLNPSLQNNYELTIRYNGVDYNKNIVKFPLTPAGESNGTWRLQMKGVSDSRQRFTDYTRNEQLVDKILIFTRIGNDHFELAVEPNARLSYYQNNSTFVDQSPPRGRYYGRL